MRAVILGGTGAIGSATALRLLRAGWRVDVTGRDERNLPGPLTRLGARFTAIDAADHAGVRRLVGSGANLLLSTTAFTAAAALDLLEEEVRWVLSRRTSAPR
ncbi:NAD-dependent epimerase/dehydratase family protein [Galactobacter caseinivorans]|uniref:NAD-dependent epimerase/dehydratase family protein n=1 Tax=Galactobacter caseinivorans TaxID=2676123 RepID=A0A496PJ96_9MICC|nr:NAD-dependent epimerase/dehydratase family protein [Galactobacter caseinivorans]RKW70572.1 NAD-dependent epimerase/dehydratase family protein [Galactobacter caseinivorans]